MGVVPLTIDCVPTAGTAGGITTLPFTGEVTSGLPYWETPVTTDGVETPDVEVGTDVFFVALA